MKKIRLQIVMRDSMNCSRRKAEEFISKGLVQVNGKTASLGDKVDPSSDTIKVSKKYIKNVSKIKRIYLKMYKPRGYITSLKDERGRKCVIDLIKINDARIFPIGRLDYNSEGLLLLTNDGQFANNILNPVYHVPKTYRVTVTPQIHEKDIIKLTSGVLIDNITTKPAKITDLKNNEGKSILNMTIYEGKNRQIHKTFASLGYTVKRLKRISIGKILISTIKPGEYKYLTQAEIDCFR